MQLRLGIQRSDEQGISLLRMLGGSAGLRVAGMFFGFLVGVQLARGLGPAGYGVYGTVMAVISILMLPTELGLPQLVTREVAATGGATSVARLIVRWAQNRVLFSSLLIAAVVSLVLATNLFQVDGDLRKAISVGLLWIPVVALGNIYGATLRGLHSVVFGQFGEFLVRPVLMSIAIFTVVSLSGLRLTPTLAMSLNVFCALTAACVSLALLRRRLRVLVSPLSGVLPEGLTFKHSLPIAMSEGLRVLASQVGILILAMTASHADVGQYRVAYQIYSVATMPSALVNIACAPMIATLFSQGRISELARLNFWISIFLTASAGVLLVSHLFFGEQVIAQVFGNGYSAAAGLLLVFFVGEIVVSVFGHPIVVLNMTRHPRVVLWWSGISLGVTAIVVVLCAPLYGAVGAAVGTSAGLVVWSGGCALHAKLRLGLETSFLTRLIKTSSSISH